MHDNEAASANENARKERRLAPIRSQGTAAANLGRSGGPVGDPLSRLAQRSGVSLNDRLPRSDLPHHRARRKSRHGLRVRDQPWAGLYFDRRARGGPAAQRGVRILARGASIAAAAGSGAHPHPRSAGRCGHRGRGSQPVRRPVAPRDACRPAQLCPARRRRDHVRRMPERRVVDRLEGTCRAFGRGRYAFRAAAGPRPQRFGHLRRRRPTDYRPASRPHD